MFKSDFPIFQNKDILYLDSAASAQKPSCVLEAMTEFYSNEYSNVHRGNCVLAHQSTNHYEQARQTVARFISAQADEIVFLRGATEGINLIANGFAQILKPGDEVLVSIAEHHANFVPWQQVCLKTGAVFKVFGLNADGTFDLIDFQSKLTSKTKIVAISHQSNVLGILNPVEKMVEMAHAVGAQVVLDAAQSIAHLKINVKNINCDYMVFSGHKLYGPTGIGCLYGKKEALELLPPYQFGGDMVKTVAIEKTEFAKLPNRLEAGTPAFSEAIGLAKAVDYINKIGFEEIQKHELFLTQVLSQALRNFPEIKILGQSSEKQGIVSFVHERVHVSDIAFMLAEQNICVRVGHHCAMPLHTYLKHPASLRVSLGLYNDEQDIQTFLDGLDKALSFF